MTVEVMGHEQLFLGHICGALLQRLPYNPVHFTLKDNIRV